MNQQSSSLHHHHFTMNTLQASILICVLTIAGQVSCNCGCLKCNKNLQVVSPPDYPYKVIVNGGHCAAAGMPSPLLYNGPSILPPLAPRLPINPLHNMATLPINPACEPFYAYKYELQAPVIPPPIPLLPVTGLVAKPDRVVLHGPSGPGTGACPAYTGCYDAISVASGRPGTCNSIWNNAAAYQRPLLPPPPPLGVIPKLTGPIIEKLPNDIYSKLACDCRYGNKRRKRDLPILKNGLHFIMGLLPNFLRFPLEQTLKLYRKPVQKPVYYKMTQTKPSVSLFQKLQKLNREDYHRRKRSLIFDDNEISLPFLRVTDIENNMASSEEEEEEENASEEEDSREQFLKPLNFDHLLPHNPIFYILNAPIRFLHQFHKFGQQISPVFKSVPHVLINSKRYLRKFGKNLKNDVLNFASHLIGDFDEFGAHNNYRYMSPRRYRRSTNASRNVEPYEPDYSLVFKKDNIVKKRTKRYILKVVDEDEVEKFLREKLGNLVHEPESPKKKKKLIVEKLSSKLIIDNNGRPFVEINGVKRPLFLNKRDKEEEHTEQPPKKEESEEHVDDMKEKINSLIIKARERIGQNSISIQNDVPVHIIKDKINEILSEIQNLVNLDFDRYSTIHNALYKLQNYKDYLVNDWKKVLIEDKSNDMSSKIQILDDFKEMQSLRDQAVHDIAAILENGTNFMTKKLIKMLVRLQKLQCIIYRVVEDFGEKIKMCTEFDVRKEIKYVELLSSLHFVEKRTKNELEKDLRKERDIALENELAFLENLRTLLENCNDSHKLYEEAKVLWEIKNIEKLQKETISEMNEKISKGQKVRKELKILFDLLKQSENSEEKQKKLLTDIHKHSHHNHRNNKDSKKRHQSKRYQQYQHDSVCPHKTIIEDKKPVRLVSNGYSLTAYKVADGFA